MPWASQTWLAPKAFYENVVGWSPEPSPPEVAFFNLNGLVFSLAEHRDLASEIPNTAALTTVGSYPGFALAHNLRSREEVDALFLRLERRGATIAKRPVEASWGGYSGYFIDPDGHWWEIAHNPFWIIEDNGSISMG